jgi:hypothetical protein
MEDRTQEFLKACKEAGYERVTIYIADKRVPLSKRLEKESKAMGAGGSYWGARPCTPIPLKVVCGFPERIGACPGLPGEGWPLMWGIVKNLGLNFEGGGSGDSYGVHKSLVGLLQSGYYDLTEIN